MNKLIYLHVAICCFSMVTYSVSGQTLKTPSFEEIISLQSVFNPEISPDGKSVVFEMRSTDWKNNRSDTEIWLSKEGKEPFQLTNNPKDNSTNPKWSPDGKWIAFLSRREDKNQLQLIRTVGGEAFQISHTQGNISDFEWSPDGKQIAYLQAEDKSKDDKKRKEKYGDFAEDNKEFSQDQLWVMLFDPSMPGKWFLPESMQDSVLKKSMEPHLLIDRTDFSITQILWSPDGKKIALEHQPDPIITSFIKSDISLYEFASQSLKILVANPGSDVLLDWSPDSKSLVYQSSLTDTTSNFYMNRRYFRIQSDGTGVKPLAASFDEDIQNITWTPQGIFGLAWQKTNRKLVHIEPDNGQVKILPMGLKRLSDFTFSNDGKKIAFTGANDNSLSEVYLSDYPLQTLQKLSQVTDQLAGWSMAQSEVIRWKSEDGTEIEGVLHKPQDYNPAKKYPLLVIIHGGPTSISVPEPSPVSVYPMIQWLNKGALILRPNYRGSAGYGEKFRSLNVRNLGVGDAWDVLSGVKYLEDKGLIDGEKVGCMGWSQGGYISAFLTTNSTKFKAISVGAGISNWMTYYVNTDIHPFTRQYLKATPWSDKAIYELTSPMTNIQKASTPTLIQHGEFDQRVPTPNAYELLQGLQDMGVESKLIIYKGFGHGITKPKERLAAIWHNWQWFAKYIWGEEVEMP